MDDLEREFFGPLPSQDQPSPFPRPVEFHAAVIHSRSKPPWDTLTQAQSIEVLKRLAAILVDSHESNALFGVIVHKPSFPEEDPVVFAFDEITRRFDLSLVRLHNQGNSQRGLMICDESRHEERLQTLLRAYREGGGPFGRLHNFSDVPLFADSRASRLLQLADFVAWATFRRYERTVANYFDAIVSRFDREGNRMHGLCHRIREWNSCFCPACFSRRAAGPSPH